MTTHRAGWATLTGSATLTLLCLCIPAVAQERVTNELREPARIRHNTNHPGGVPRPIPAPQSATKSTHIDGVPAWRDTSVRQASATAPISMNAASGSGATRDVMVRAALHQRAADARPGNAIRLTGHHEPEGPLDKNGPSLRWVDPAKAAPLQDRGTPGWHTRGEAAPATKTHDALLQPFGHGQTPTEPLPEIQPAPAYTRQHAPQAANTTSSWTGPSMAAAQPESVSQIQPELEIEPFGQDPTPADDPLARPFDAPAVEDLPVPAEPAEPMNPPPGIEPPAQPGLEQPGLAPPMPPGLESPGQGPSGDMPPAPAPGVLDDPQPTPADPGLEGDDLQYYQQHQATLDPLANRECLDEVSQNTPYSSIRQISLDITDDYAVDVKSREERQRLRLERLSNIPARKWTNVRGQLVASGQLVDFTQGVVHIHDDATETIRKFPLHEMGDDERCFVAACWKLPVERRMVPGDEVAATRNFTPITLTWTASALCNKPAYFEQRDLERYGHAAHPLIQPALSGAHFFGSIAVLPYNMGIHPPYECQYDLGHYRPGSCAPWLLRPVPISLRGALAEAGVFTGGFFLIP